MSTAEAGSGVCRGCRWIAQFPATIDPGEPARLVITPRPGCAHPAKYTKPVIVVAGREVPVAGTATVTACAVTIGDWHVIPPVLNR